VLVAHRALPFVPLVVQLYAQVGPSLPGTLLHFPTPDFYHYDGFPRNSLLRWGYIRVKVSQAGGRHPK